MRSAEMPRVSRTWSYEASKRRYVANINKEKIVLLKDVDRNKDNDDLAKDKYDKAKAIAEVQVTGDRTAVSIALDAWLKWLQSRPQDPVTQNTFVQYQQVVWSFTDFHGDVAGRDIS